MKNNKTKLMEMSETEEGYTLNNLSPFFLHRHIYELLEKSKTALLIYTELQKIASPGASEKIIDIIQKAESLNYAKNELQKEFGISEPTADNILNSQLHELLTLEADDYSDSIEIYEEAVRALTIIADKQQILDSLITE